MFGWFKRRPKQLLPESKWVVTINDGILRVTDEAGESKAIAFDDLSGISIHTNDSGPWGIDLWWCFYGTDDQLACAFPGGATGEQSAQDRLLKMPGFDYDEFTKAVRSTQNAVFPVWRKND